MCLRAFFYVLTSTIILVTAVPATSQNWAGFYTPTSSPQKRERTDSGSVGKNGIINTSDICIQEILDAQRRYQIPANLLLAIGLQEAGYKAKDGRFTVWPWTVNAAGEGRMFDSPDAAMQWVQERRQNGVESIDIGCMQINQKWHPDAFESLSDGFDPKENVDYAARFLVSLYEKTGDWMRATGSYHSFTPDKQDVYLAGIQKNLSFIEKSGGKILSPIVISNQRIPELEETQEELDVAVENSGRPMWTSQLGVNLNGVEGSFSIYSNTPMEPVIPDMFRMQ